MPAYRSWTSICDTVVLTRTYFSATFFRDSASHRIALMPREAGQFVAAVDPGSTDLGVAWVCQRGEVSEECSAVCGCDLNIIETRRTVESEASGDADRRC